MPADYPPAYRTRLVDTLVLLDKLSDDTAVSGMDEWAIERVTLAVEDALEAADEERAERVEAEADALVEAMLDAVAGGVVMYAEKLRTVHGSYYPDDRYRWRVEVWSTDHDAVAYLRVVLKVHRVKHRRILPDSKREVYRASDVASPDTLQRTVDEMSVEGERIVERLDEGWDAARAVES